MFEKNLHGNVFENSGLYTFVEICKANAAPLRSITHAIQNWINSPFHPVSYLALSRVENAYLELFDRFTRDYPKAGFNIRKTTVERKEHYIEEEIIIEKTFCKLIHFRKFPHVDHLPKLLIVAPLSGHHATLLRGTVEDCLPFFDVYITDWANARDISIDQGSFGFHDFIDYSIEFMHKLAPNLSVMAVCQPSVPVSAAVAIMSEDNPKSINIPDNIILIGGPIDTRVNLTKVNNYAQTSEIQWFENNVITRVPINYPGYMRQVYPGFLQLAGFMSMNMKRHIGEHIKLFQHLVVGDEESTEAHVKFYDEYLSVMDLTAEFYLETIDEVFKKHSLPLGTLVSRGRPVNLQKIEKSSLLVLEGEFDDITGLEQTKAALDLCTGIPASRKEYHLQKGVGHYGLFNGSKFRNNIVPLIRDFCYKHLKVKQL